MLLHIGSNKRAKDLEDSTDMHLVIPVLSKRVAIQKNRFQLAFVIQRRLEVLLDSQTPVEILNRFLVPFEVVQ